MLYNDIYSNVFSDSQYGFRQKRGCISQLLKVFDDWSKFVDDGKPLDVIYLDVRNAFDFFPYKRLLHKIFKTPWHIIEPDRGKYT